MHSAIQVLTRSERTGVKYFTAVLPAFYEWKRDPTIWKISWFKNNRSFRFVVKKRSDQWNPFSEDKLSRLSSSYQKSKPDQLFLVQQKLILSPEEQEKFDTMYGYMSGETYAYHEMAERIEAIYTPEEFISNFRNI